MRSYALQLALLGCLLASTSASLLPRRHTSSASGSSVRRGRQQQEKHRQLTQRLPCSARSSHVALCSVLNLSEVLKIGALYTKAQASFPRATCVTQGCLLSVLGDALSQEIYRRAEPHEPGEPSFKFSKKRFLIAGAAGCVFDGFVIPTWYGLLHGLVPGHTRFRGLVMTAIDLCILSTCGNLANMMLRNLLGSGSLQKAWHETRAKVLGVILLDLRLFPAYDIIVFSFVPKHVQALCTAFVCCLWNCYLSSVTAASARTERLAAAATGV